MARNQILFFQQLEQLPYRGDISEEELAKHNKPDDCWCSYLGYVYDMTCYLEFHPGGAQTILDFAGADMGPGFQKRHRYIAPTLFEKLKIGKLITKEKGGSSILSNE